ncbi:bromodomain adjacent to zinc finger domain protein 1A, partial [Nematolebias whitei]|uniref:bromodomain adjacent to zinc finger domain protein 1A n=1 Tax=Nematolebias whitei TaxID=451745 RepID=UPI001897C5A0
LGDVYSFAKDRFFPGEVVDVSGRKGARYVCEILHVHAPYSSANGAPPTNGQNTQAGDDTIIIIDSDDESDAFQSPTTHFNCRKKKPLSPSLFKYTVSNTKDEHSKPFTVNASQISRRKSSLSREKLRLLFKHHCEIRRGIITLKPSTVKKFCLSEQNFSQFFPDDPPFFHFSSTSNGGSPGQMCVSPLNALEEKLKLLQKKDEMAAAAQIRAQLKEREELQKARRERDDKDRLREEQRLRFEEEKHRKKEEKERRKLEKEREREKLKEEKKKYAERLKQWNQPREDMECEDLKVSKRIGNQTDREVFN